MAEKEQELLTQPNFDELYMYQRPQRTSLREKVKTCGNGTSWKDKFCSLFPILLWMKDYSWKDDLLFDCISGFTVAVMHIPQGMAYSMLAGVPPIIGIYMAFFPVLIYILMGTSRHVSMGTFAVICMMAGKVVSQYSSHSSSVADHPLLNSTTLGSSLSEVTQSEYTPIEVATCVCFVVGLWQFFLGVFKLGGLSVLLSDTLVSGFTTGAAVHVATSQVKHLFGIKVARFMGPLKIIYTYVDLFKKIETTNLIALGVSIPVIIVLVLYNELAKPVITKKLPVPLPIELITVVLGAMASWYGNLSDYNVTTIGDIPTGFPKPSVPPFELMLNIVIDGLIIAIVSFSVNMSMASFFAKKCNYKINGSQELLASGISNMFASFFSCLPFGASLSRSLIQKNSGGRTQIASLVSCFCLLLVLLWIGPFFEPLPQCVLAALVIVSLKGMFVQVFQLKAIWHHSTKDGLVWLITFISVVVIDIDIGLGIGIFLSVVTIFLLGQKLKIVQLGNIPGTDIYLDMSHYQAALEVPRIAILQIGGGMHFANCDYVKGKLSRIIHKKLESTENKISYVILDTSCIAFLDPAAVKTLLSLYHELKERSVEIYLTYCSVSIREKLLHLDFFEDFPENHVFPFTHNAVMHLRHHNDF
ncbi:solute carrier family 26 member 10-like isoform X2 [Ischnura elegans]|nr:solute carrier family 26 member 10-like isoform X2 [Ischnura elegans]XP_046405469.1 solute carrier family 26 member 10-like isoform X2 [Ischnura elegans]